MNFNSMMFVFHLGLYNLFEIFTILRLQCDYFPIHQLIIDLVDN